MGPWSPGINASGAWQVRQIFWAGVALLVFTELLALTDIAPAPHRFITPDPNSHSPFFAYAVAGVFALHAIVHGPRVHLWAALAIGAILTGLHAALFFQAHRHWLLVMSTICYYLGIGSIIVLAWLSLRLRHTDQGRGFAETLRSAFLFPLFVSISWFYLEASSALRPVTFDTTLYHFEASLGLQASELAGRLFETSDPSAMAGFFAYVALPLFAAVLFGFQVRRGDSSTNVLKVFLLVAVVGYAIYFLYPVAGPRFLFGDRFPDRLPDLALVSLQPALLPPAYRNAMPSLHMAWALVLWFGARHFSLPVRAAFGALVVATVLATLGRGEHYLVDLVVAFPLALLAQAWCSQRHGRGETAVAGLLMLCGWLLYLSTCATLFQRVGRMHWIPILLTVVLTLRLESRLSRGIRPAAGRPAIKHDGSGLE